MIASLLALLAAGCAGVLLALADGPLAQSVAVLGLLAGLGAAWPRSTAPLVAQEIFMPPLTEPEPLVEPEPEPVH